MTSADCDTVLNRKLERDRSITGINMTKAISSVGASVETLAVVPLLSGRSLVLAQLVLHLNRSKAMLFPPGFLQ
jgi:hypothetical protein